MKGSRMKAITVWLPIWMVKEVDKLVKLGMYKDRAEFIRSAIRELLRRERVIPFTDRGIPK